MQRCSYAIYIFSCMGVILGEPPRYYQPGLLRSPGLFPSALHRAVVLPLVSAGFSRVSLPRVVP